MNKYKTIFSVSLLLIFLLSCSLVTKLKEKLSSDKKDKREKIEESDKEKTVKKTSAEDFAFYNKYIEVSNNISKAGDDIYKNYTSDVPAPKQVTKSSFIIAVGFGLSVNSLERTIKDYKRSLYDGGDLSKLSAENKDMQKETEENFKTLLLNLESYYETSKKVSEYYKSGEFKQDLSMVDSYDKQMKDGHDSYRETFDKFFASLKKYKPVREKRDLESIKDPEVRSMAVLMEAYETTLDEAEPFYERFQLFDANKNEEEELLAMLDRIDKGFDDQKKNVQSEKFTDITKYYKYSFEDYFSNSVNNFLKEARAFLKDNKNGKLNKSNFNYRYDNVVNYYNFLVQAYNTNINVLNSYKPIKY